jgi:N-acetylmuramoyl-L-alanine amidase
MRSAAYRLSALALLALGLSAGLSGATSPIVARALPSRPDAAPVSAAPHVALRVGNVEYVSATDVAVWLDLKGSWTEPQRKLRLTSKTNSANRVEFEADKRIAFVDGLRVDLGNPTVLRGGHLYIGRTDLEHCLAPLLRPAVVGRVPRLKTIAIDPGHGGWDPGMENKKLGLQEKVLALDVSLRLQKLLETAGYRVVMTRATDTALAPDKKKDLLTRAEIANRAGADLFVSVHFNSLFPDTKTTGTEIYVYTPPGQRSTNAWSLGEEDDTKHEAQPVNRFDPWSSLLAHQLHRQVTGRLKTADRGQKTKHLLVFQDLNCPAALVESVFLSNDGEGRHAATPEYRQEIAVALAAGIRDYAAVLNSLAAKPAAARATSRVRATSPSS